MNIEQEFKEIKQLLLDSYKADYEDTLNQAIDKLDKLNEAINYTHCCTELCDDKDKVFICGNETCMMRKCNKCGDIS